MNLNHPLTHYLCHQVTIQQAINQSLTSLIDSSPMVIVDTNDDGLTLENILCWIQSETLYYLPTIS